MNSCSVCILKQKGEKTKVQSVPEVTDHFDLLININESMQDTQTSFILNKSLFMVSWY